MRAEYNDSSWMGKIQAQCFVFEANGLGYGSYVILFPGKVYPIGLVFLAYFFHEVLFFHLGLVGRVAGVETDGDDFIILAWFHAHFVNHVGYARHKGAANVGAIKIHQGQNGGFVY